MGINKSGITDKSMMIHGGNVSTVDGKLVIEGDVTCPVHNPIDPHGLTHPPAVVQTELVPFTNNGELIPANLPIVYTTTLPRHIRDLLFRDGYIIHVGWTAIAGLGVATAIDFYFWCIALYHTVMGAMAVLATNAGLILLAMGAVFYVLAGAGSGNGGSTIPIKACAKSGIKGPIHIPAGMVVRK